MIVYSCLCDHMNENFHDCLILMKLEYMFA